MKPYACHNRKPFNDTLVVQDGWTGQVSSAPHTRRPHMVTIPFVMARECMYARTALGVADTRCAGCGHRPSAAA